MQASNAWHRQTGAPSGAAAGLPAPLPLPGGLPVHTCPPQALAGCFVGVLKMYMCRVMLAGQKSLCFTQTDCSERKVAIQAPHMMMYKAPIVYLDGLV